MRKLGVLEFYEATEPEDYLGEDGKEVSTAMEYGIRGVPPRIVIRSKVDARLLGVPLPLNNQQMETILAHEMGHFIGKVLKNPLQMVNLVSAGPASESIKDVMEFLTMEADAFRVGKLVYPNQDPLVVRRCLEAAIVGTRSSMALLPWLMKIVNKV